MVFTGFVGPEFWTEQIDLLGIKRNIVFMLLASFATTYTIFVFAYPAIKVIKTPKKIL